MVLLGLNIIVFEILSGTARSMLEISFMEFSIPRRQKQKNNPKAKSCSKQTNNENYKTTIGELRI